jgi:subtilisin family serine protease
MTIAAAPEGRFGAAFEWLGVEHAWTRTRGSPAVVIAILDEGVQRDHPLLVRNIHQDPVHNPACTGEREIPGTEAAGVAAGRTSDAEQFSGVAPNAHILPVRFMTGTHAQALDLAHAIEYAVEMGANIINISPAGDFSAPAVTRAIQYAAARNALVVSAVRDSDPAPTAADDDPVPNQITVLSVSARFEPLSTYTGKAAHLAAPGFARVPRWRASGYAPLENAALGAAYVSGCAALVKAQNPAWGYHEIKEHLLASGTPHPELAALCHTARLLNVGNAVLGPIELASATKKLEWSALQDAEIRWKLRYRCAYCVNAVALYRPHGDEHWRELAYARADAMQMTIPAAALRRSSGTLRIACRESNFFTDEVALTIR